MTRFFKTIHYIFCMFFYFAGMAALLVLIGTIGPLWTVAAGLLIAVWRQRRATRKMQRLFERNWAVHPDVSDISPNLGKIMADLYARSGVDPEKYPLYDLRLCDKDRAEHEHAEDPENPENNDGVQKAVQALQRKSESYLAAVIYAGKPVLAVAAPLLAMLDDEEERAVLAHELVHLREKHIYTSYALTILCAAVIWAATLVRIAWFFAAGWEAAVYAGMAGISAGLLIVRWIRKKGHWGKTGGQWQQFKVFLTISCIVSVLVMAVFMPLYPLIFFTSFLMQIAAWTILRGRSRTSEYRADAGIVDLGANPLAMMTALRRLQYLHDDAAEKAGARRRLNAPTLRNRVRKNLYATHPPIDDRLTHLAKIARRHGYPEEDIRTAEYGSIEIDKTHSYPMWMIEYMRSQ